MIAAASASHIIAKPQVGTPYSRAKTAAPAAYGSGSTRAAWVPRFPAAVTGVDLTRTLWAVWTAGRCLTGPARHLYTIAARSGRRPRI